MTMISIEANSSSDKTGDQHQYQKTLDKAYDYLSRREYSRFELSSKIKKLCDEVVCQRVLDVLVKTNAQSDWRFAKMLCRSRFNAGKGPAVIEYELQQNHIDSEVCLVVMESYANQWKASAQKVRQQKFGEQPPDSFKEWVRQSRFLQQRGFTEEQIDHYDGR